MTIWKNRNPGEPDHGVTDVSEELGTPAVLLYDKPDWVRHPTTQDKVRVLAADSMQMCCPSCNEDVTGRVVIGEDPDPKMVICCLDCPACNQFVWFTTKKPDEVKDDT